MPYKPKLVGRKEYCSRKCYFESITRISKERAVLRRIAKNNKPPFIHDCIICEQPFFTENKRIKICSRACRRIQANKQQRIYDRGSNWPRKRDCKKCGQLIEITKNGPRKYCKECGEKINKAHKKIAKIKRKYKIKATQTQTIISINQFERDNWICQLCGCDVDLIKPTNKDNYAHLDHIIPLSKGGQHITNNVQTLCRKCNINKANLMPQEVQHMLNNKRNIEYRIESISYV